MTDTDFDKAAQQMESQKMALSKQAQTAAKIRESLEEKAQEELLTKNNYLIAETVLRLQRVKTFLANSEYTYTLYEILQLLRVSMAGNMPKIFKRLLSRFKNVERYKKLQDINIDYRVFQLGRSIVSESRNAVIEFNKAAGNYRNLLYIETFEQSRDVIIVTFHKETSMVFIIVGPNLNTIQALHEKTEKINVSDYLGSEFEG